MTTNENLNYDNQDYDLNSLFNFNYNFDILKRLIESLAKGQKAALLKVAELEDKLCNKDKRVEEIEKLLSTQKEVTTQRFKSIELTLVNVSKSVGINLDKSPKKVNKLESEKSSSISIVENMQGININNIKEENSALQTERSVNEEFLNNPITNTNDELKEENKTRNKHKKHTSSSVYNNNTNNQITTPVNESYIGADVLSPNKELNLRNETIENINHSRRQTLENISNSPAGGMLDMDDIINKIMKRLVKLEKENIESKSILSDFSSVKEKTHSNQGKIVEHSVLIKTLQLSLDELINKTSNWSENLEQLNIKMTDFNIYDLFKNNSDGGSSDAGVILVQNLENKVFKKFGFVDERVKHLEEDNHKGKAEISNLKAITDGLGRTNQHMREEIDHSGDIYTSRQEEVRVALHALNNLIVDNHGKVLAKIEEKSKEIDELMKEKDTLMKAMENEDESNSPTNKDGKSSMLPENFEKIIKEITRKMIDLEKNFRLFSSNINIERINHDITKLFEVLNHKVTYSEHHELKENMSQMTFQINFLKDNLTQLLEDRKMIDDINWLRKKVETLSSNVLNLKDQNEMGSSTNNVSKAVLDHTKFVDWLTFNDFVKQTHVKDIEKLTRYCDELNRFIEDLFQAMKTKAGDKDMKNLEELLITKIEEFRLQAGKKFADKSETSKNVKFLDSQIKHIIEVYIKKMEKGDNWLIAKKPVNGYTCASCESYIGDLHDKNEHVNWNKIHGKEHDKSYRVI
jgi:hypothetical protein